MLTSEMTPKQPHARQIAAQNSSFFVCSKQGAVCNELALLHTQLNSAAGVSRAPPPTLQGFPRGQQQWWWCGHMAVVREQPRACTHCRLLRAFWGSRCGLHAGCCCTSVQILNRARRAGSQGSVPRPVPSATPIAAPTGSSRMRKGVQPGHEDRSAPDCAGAQPKQGK
jgi:hypothetical protein